MLWVLCASYFVVSLYFHFRNEINANQAMILKAEVLLHAPYSSP
jgi:hypothetical protein